MVGGMEGQWKEEGVGETEGRVEAGEVKGGEEEGATVDRPEPNNQQPPPPPCPCASSSSSSTSSLSFPLLDHFPSFLFISSLSTLAKTEETLPLLQFQKEVLHSSLPQTLLLSSPSSVLS